ncbi:unnamed protein product [Lactuca virosa]|uniref:Uncharacterized protein n=1 Tax=Lactuca virosa TaxID=75947 RepID=A0AAU9PMW6_9ASTR|nr:unnamed protein product [Lactuca virosa]
MFFINSSKSCFHNEFIQATKLRAATSLNHHLLSTPNKNSKISPPTPSVFAPTTKHHHWQPSCLHLFKHHHNLSYSTTNEKWRLETNLKEKSGDEQKTPGEERKASEPHTEASAEDEELQTIPVCFRQTSDEEDGDVVNGEEEDDVVNGEEHGGVRSFHESDRETFKMKKN